MSGIDWDAEHARIIEALIGVVAERGYESTTVEMIVAAAGVDEESFARYFDDKESCYLAAWEHLNDVYLERVLSAHEAEDEWRDRIRAVAHETVRCIQEHPKGGRVLSLAVLEAGERARALRDETMRALATLVHAGREHAPDPDSVPYTTAEGIVGAAYSRICASLRHGNDAELPAAVPELMCFAVIPYLGLEAGLEELQRPGPDSEARASRGA